MMTQMRLADEDGDQGYTRLIGVIGRPVPPWPSTRIFNAASQARGLNWLCMPLPVSAGRLREALRGLGALGFVGIEVREPYEYEAAAYLKDLSPSARAIGAVNRIRVDASGHLVGDHTRWSDFLATVRQFAPTLKGLRPLIIGAGPSAQSIVYALTHQGLPLTIVDERIEKAIDLVHRLRRVMDEHSFSVYRWPQDLNRAVSGADLIVNATGIGAWPDADRSPWPGDVPFPAKALVFDLVSCPSETRFLGQARLSGARTVSGLSLAVFEAARSFERWTGHRAPIGVMWRVAQQALPRRVPQGTELPENGDSRVRVPNEPAYIAA
jgi:shikimate dehydrogenase